MDITLAGGAVTYEPNDDQLGRVSLEFAAFDGEVGFGTLPVPDAAAALTVAGGRQARVDEDTTLLSDGFIVDHDRDRGPEPAGTAREYSFGIADANALLDGFRVRVSRPSETDVARVLAQAAVDGPAWDTTWVLNSDTVTMPAKRYDSDSGWTAELIPDLVEFTGKTLFLHDKADGSGRCLHYHVLTAGHTSGLTITDDGSVVNGVNIFAPQSPVRNRTSVDLRNSIRGRDQAGRIYRADDSASISTHNADGLQHEALIDFETTGLADLKVKTKAFLASQKDELDTYTVAIGPLDFAALALIRVGDFIATTSSVLGLTASAQRIAHMTLTPYAPGGIPSPGLWNAALELSRPIRRRARIKGRKPPVILPPFVEECGVTDTFDRPNGASGTADCGLVWSDFGSPAPAIVDARLYMPAGSNTSLPVVVPSVYRVAIDFELTGTDINLFVFELGDTGAALGLFPSIAEVEITCDGTLGSVSSSGPVSFTFAAGLYHLRSEYSVGHITVRIWPDGDPEPGVWLIDYTDPSPPAYGGNGFGPNYQGGPFGVDEVYLNDLDITGICGTPTAPLPGQFVPDVTFIGDGVTTAFATAIGYVVGSLVLTVSGLDWSAQVTETDPATGAYTTAYPPGSGSTVRATYQAAP